MKRIKHRKITYYDWWKLLLGMKMKDLNMNYWPEITEKGVIMHDERKLVNVNYNDYYKYKNPLKLLKI